VYILTSQELIESGTLELYCLGLSTKEEQRIVEQQVEGNELLENYILELEARIRAYFNNDFVEPPEGLREIIALRTGSDPTTKPKHTFSKKESKIGQAGGPYLEIEVDDTHIKVHKYWRPAFITVLILSKVFLIGGLYFYFKSNSLQEEVERLRTELLNSLR
jgi:hypothetical protein